MAAMDRDPVVLVTGAAGGIGFEIVRHLLEELNGRVVAVDIVKGDLEHLAAAHAERLEVVVGDITDVSDTHMLTRPTTPRLRALMWKSKIDQ
jgi:NAD(P)-dependent dehydrogenase (short-subunit alcohol dehydrogenase family)